MLGWLSLALVLATNVAALPSPQSPQFKEPSDAPSQCQARAWVRAPDMVPGEVIAGDVKIKLSGPCSDAESYTLGLRYKEKVFWKLRHPDRREDAPIPKIPKLPVSNSDLFRVRPSQNSRNPDYNEAEWKAYENSVQNKDLWSIHEEERIAFEIKSPLITDPLSTNFTTRFGVLVPNTNYPPGLDCRGGFMAHGGATDMISSESIYEYFVEIGFSNGTISEIPAGMTAFTPFYLLTESSPPSVNVSLSLAPARRSGSNMKPSVDRLRSNYTIELSVPEGAHVYQNSSVNLTAIVHRIGYTNRTDTPVELCAFSASGIEWHSQELQNRSWSFPPSIKALVPSVAPVRYSQFSQIVIPNPVPCREIKFAATPAPLTHESHILSTSSEPLSLSLYVNRDAVSDFSTYYQKLGHSVKLNLYVAPDPSEPWDNEFEKIQWEKQIAHAGGEEFDWVPWMPPTQPRRRFLSGNANILSVIPMQEQGPARSTPIHYLSDKARQPVFVDSSDIADLRLMLPEERDLIAPLTQPSIKVFAKGEELPRRYFTGGDMRYPIYVGDTWVKKVLPITAEGQRERDAVDHLLVVQS
ncbi:uncharacterized protein BJ212DRAFT_1300357 [Suillus subaureus]|uniref:Arrestin-like N-terminal domain-containing protein n=1 Tax=Suillus subaureus TaxID=48587 RepID=A0A9P7E9P3_9AGAM|nr:uncharacterized protein BJ212DRAFT_1300357 [Suillus subaureus]KAG1815194.1 hypothetical protein BJ212DRAFT_1300357 [Suillus subaureus]